MIPKTATAPSGEISNVPSRVCAVTLSASTTIDRHLHDSSRVVIHVINPLRVRRTYGKVVLLPDERCFRFPPEASARQIFWPPLPPMTLSRNTRYLPSEHSHGSPLMEPVSVANDPLAPVSGFIQCSAFSVSSIRRPSCVHVKFVKLKTGLICRTSAPPPVADMTDRLHRPSLSTVAST